MTVTPISKCKNISCQADISVGDVFKEKDVRTAPGHVVLHYTCSKCGMHGRIVGETEVWQDRQRAAVYGRYELDRDVAAFAEDLDALVDTPHDLENIWASYSRPPMMENRVRCMCRICEEKRYRQ